VEEVSVDGEDDGVGGRRLLGCHTPALRYLDQTGKRLIKNESGTGNKATLAVETANFILSFEGVKTVKKKEKVSLQHAPERALSLRGKKYKRKEKRLWTTSCEDKGGVEEEERSQASATMPPTRRPMAEKEREATRRSEGPLNVLNALEVSLAPELAAPVFAAPLEPLFDAPEEAPVVVGAEVDCE
jgi:hypothetical protein